MCHRGFGFPFLMWGGGGDGSSDMQREGVSHSQQADAPAGAAAAAGASEDEQIYGTPSPQANAQSSEGVEGMIGNEESSESGGQGSVQEETMQDPWTLDNEESSGPGEIGHEML